ncbi:unnamed protein product [Lathyrus oleraceus]|uniref:uncharacterized protein LOC127086741 n=1 Tax=Pisum sativum TaxID=3888 RepID=UPI0021D0979E|nr:uncharacterized protein LOC127086741 [Pisum sativum]
MGNCLIKNQISSKQDENEDIKRVMKMKTPKREEDGMKRKVRFKIQDGNSSIMRIKVVVSKEELKRVLRNKNIENGVKNSSLEELLNDMKLKEKSVAKIEEVDGGLNCWRPDLDSIPEDYSMK